MLLVTAAVAACAEPPPTNLLSLCEADAPNVQVMAVFRVQAIRDIQKRIPASSFGPLVANIRQPGFIVVFRRPYRVLFENRPNPPFQVDNVACAYFDGAAHLYTNLDLTGFDQSLP